MKEGVKLALWALLILLGGLCLASFFINLDEPKEQLPDDLLIYEENETVKVTYPSGDTLLISVEGVEIEKYYLNLLWEEVYPREEERFLEVIVMCGASSSNSHAILTPSLDDVYVSDDFGYYEPSFRMEYEPPFLGYEDGKVLSPGEIHIGYIYFEVPERLYNPKLVWKIAGEKVIWKLDLTKPPFSS